MTPRLIATAVMLPLLTIIADFVGLIGGYLIAYDHAATSPSRSTGPRPGSALEYNDLAQGLLKPFLFAIVIALVGCFYGMRTTGGTQGVGRATTKAVVVASVWIFVITSMLDPLFVNLDSELMSSTCAIRQPRQLAAVLRFDDVSLHFRRHAGAGSRFVCNAAPAKRAWCWARRAAARPCCSRPPSAW